MGVKKSVVKPLPEDFGVQKIYISKCMRNCFKLVKNIMTDYIRWG